MSGRKAGAYGTNTGGDTDFRKTWDREEYAAKAAERDAKAKVEGKARAEAAAAGKKYVRRASTPPDVREAEARAKRMDLSNVVGKQTLVPAGAGVGRRGKGAGFYCEACDLTFKDNVQWIEHENSMQHLANTGQTAKVRKATLDEVKARFEYLKRKKEEEQREDVLDLGKRLQDRREQDELEREEKRRKRNEKRRSKKNQDGD